MVLSTVFYWCKNKHPFVILVNLSCFQLENYVAITSRCGGFPISFVNEMFLIIHNYNKIKIKKEQKKSRERDIIHQSSITRVFSFPSS